MKGDLVCYLCGAVGQHDAQTCPLRKYLLGVALACAICAKFVDAGHMVTVITFGTLVVLAAWEFDPRVAIGALDWPAWLQWWALAVIFPGMAQALEHCSGVAR